MQPQHTPDAPLEFEGRGVHGGAPARLRILPAAPDSGLVFVREDRGGAQVAAHWTALAGSARATTLQAGGVEVSTVEHLLAALHGLGVDNARLLLDGPEVPVLDGSAAPFVAALRAGGLRAQAAPRARLRLARPLRIEAEGGRRSIEALPAPAGAAGLAIDYAIDFAHPAIGRQRIAIAALDAATFARELAPARTFGLLEEVEALHAAGLARGASLDNTLVLDAAGVCNPGGLRFADEFVRHKALDLVGDLALLGARLDARVRVERGGHALHQQLVAAIAAACGAAPGRATSHPGAAGGGAR